VTDGQTDGQNYDSQDRASIAASRGKNGLPVSLLLLLFGIYSDDFIRGVSKVT